MTIKELRNNQRRPIYCTCTSILAFSIAGWERIIISQFTMYIRTLVSQTLALCFMQIPRLRVSVVHTYYLLGVGFIGQCMKGLI